MAPDPMTPLVRPRKWKLADDLYIVAAMSDMQANRDPSLVSRFVSLSFRRACRYTVDEAFSS
jgi:hypothetical protein